MAPNQNQMFRDLVAYLSAPSLRLDFAVEALKEYIVHRRSKGDTLFEVSIGLAELEEQTPPHTSPAFERAKHATHIPNTCDLSPPTGAFPLHRSQSPATIVNYLLSQPVPEFSESLEVVYEYLSIRENKLKEKKYGKGGKGTLSREALEDMSARLTEIEDGLCHVDGRRLEKEELDDARTRGMTLVLSIRMSFSYFTLQELSTQLLLIDIPTCEGLLVHHIKRRVEGEGRWSVGNELEHLERITVPKRPALKTAFRSAKARTLLPDKPTYQITLPAPNKSACIKLLQSFGTDGSLPTSSSSYFSRRGFAGTGNDPSSPKSPTSPSVAGPSHGPRRLADYAQEVLTEFATRERREYMLKCKWARSGRDQLGKDIGEMEQALCLLSRQQPSPSAPMLLPVFLELRRTFLLPPSPLPAKLVDAFIDQLPTPAQEEPFREPTLQSATSALYVNPRLEDFAALDVLEELIVYEIDMLKNANRPHDVPSWVMSLIDNIKLRFPDGSYESVFEQAKRLALDSTGDVGVPKQQSMHRRAVSSFVNTPEESESPPKPPHLHHIRSTSLPHRRNTIDSMTDTDSDESIGVELTATRSSTTADRASMLPPVATSMDRPPILPPLSFVSPIEPEAAPETEQATPSSAGGWWDVVSAVQTQPPSAPWTDNYRSTNRSRTTSGGFNSLPLPPGAEPATIAQPHETQLEQFKSIERNSTPSSPATPAKRIVSLDGSPASPPAMDFSKRQSAGLNEEMGNLMLSSERSSRTDIPSLAPIRTDLTPQNARSATPRGPARHYSDLGQSGGSSSRASPTAPGYQRAHTDNNALKQSQNPQTLRTAYSDSDSDSVESPSQPTIRHVGPASQHQMLQTMSRTPIMTPTMTDSPNRSSPMSAAKPKSRGWKSVSAAIGISKDKGQKEKDKEKEKGKDKEREKENMKIKNGNKTWAENDPGRWNKDMVANIMGKPADRR